MRLICTIEYRIYVYYIFWQIAFQWKSNDIIDGLIRVGQNYTEQAYVYLDIALRQWHLTACSIELDIFLEKYFVFS